MNRPYGQGAGQSPAEIASPASLGALIDALLLFLCIVAVRHFIYRGWDKDKIEK